MGKMSFESKTDHTHGKRGYAKPCGFAFALALCVQCEECAYPEPCLHPHLARPAMDAYGMDVGKPWSP